MGWSAKFLNRAFAGDREACRALLAEIPAPLPEPGTFTNMGPTVMLYAVAIGCATVGFADDAAALYASVVERAAAFAIGPFDNTIALRVAGVCAAAGRDWDVAEEHFERARRLADEWPNRLDQPNVLHSHARMLLDRGAPADRDTCARDARGGPRDLRSPRHAHPGGPGARHSRIAQIARRQRAHVAGAAGSLPTPSRMRSSKSARYATTAWRRSSVDAEPSIVL